MESVNESYLPPPHEPFTTLPGDAPPELPEIDRDTGMSKCRRYRRRQIFLSYGHDGFELLAKKASPLLLRARCPFHPVIGMGRASVWTLSGWHQLLPCHCWCFRRLSRT